METEDSFQLPMQSYPAAFGIHGDPAWARAGMVKRHRSYRGPVPLLSATPVNINSSSSSHMALDTYVLRTESGS